MKEKEKYKKIAEYIVDLIQDDPSSPVESLHTVIYRIKDEQRLIEKINTLNERMDADARINPDQKKSFLYRRDEERGCDALQRWG